MSKLSVVTGHSNYNRRSSSRVCSLSGGGIPGPGDWFRVTGLPPPPPTARQSGHTALICFQLMTFGRRAHRRASHYCIGKYELSVSITNSSLISITFSSNIRYILAEPVFVDHLRSPGIDSHPGGPVRQPYFSYRLAEPHRLAESISRNRFLGSINDYKYGLWRHTCCTVDTR
jgi:hypothetical protein